MSDSSQEAVPAEEVMEEAEPFFDELKKGGRGGETGSESSPSSSETELSAGEMMGVVGLDGTDGEACVTALGNREVEG